MSNEGDVNATSTIKVRPERGKKNFKGKKHQKLNEKMPLDPTPSETLIDHQPLTTESSDYELVKESIDVTKKEGGSQGLKWRGMPWRY